MRGRYSTSSRGSSTPGRGGWQGSTKNLFEKRLDTYFRAGALVKCLLEEEDFTDSVLRIHEHIERFDEIIEGIYNFDRFDKSSFSFTVWCGMIEFLAKATKTARRGETRDLIQRVYFHVRFFWEYGFSCLLKLASFNPGHKPNCDRDFIFSSTENYILNIVEIIKWMLSYIKESSDNEDVWKLLGLCAKLIKSGSIKSVKTKSQIKDIILHCKKVKDRLSVSVEDVAKETRKEQNKPNHFVKRPVVTELPGDLRLNGRRHDNDFEDFRNIQVYPTSEELCSPLAPFLPNELTNTDIFIDNPIDKYLDRNFRLLREDSIGNFKFAIQSFKEQIKTLTPNQHTLRIINENFQGVVQKCSTKIYC